MELVVAVLIAFGISGGLVLNRWWIIPAWSIAGVGVWLAMVEGWDDVGDAGMAFWAVVVAATVRAGAVLGLLTRRLVGVLARAPREPSRRVVRQ